MKTTNIAELCENKNAVDKIEELVGNHQLKVVDYKTATTSDILIASLNELNKLVDNTSYKMDENIIATLMRATMVATTGSIEYPKVFTDKGWLEEVIYGVSGTEMLMTLGKAISKNGECLPYKAFKDANPHITSKIYSSTIHPYIAEAIYGLSYLTFIMNDEYINKLVDGIIG